MNGSRVVLVPLRSFTDAKSRLSTVLNADQRQRLAEKSAERVIQSAGISRTLVVCDDQNVANWARNIGVKILQVSAVGLNASLHEAIRALLNEMRPREVVIAHGDLALPAALGALDELVSPDGDVSQRVFIIPDRHGDGTNVLGIGSAHLAGWRFSYGPGSFKAHQDQAISQAASLDIIRHADLGVDIDTPDDLMDDRVRSVIKSLLPDWNPHEQ
jgi:2-phospho-L-lactate guanylyltransferase